MNKNSFLVVSIIGALTIFFLVNNKRDNPLPQNYFNQESRALAIDPVITQTEVTWKTDIYRDTVNGFSLSLLSNQKTEELYDEYGKSVMIKENSNKEEGFYMQIYISPFDESGPITPARIKKDLPEIKIENPKDLLVDGVPALGFLSVDREGQKFREVWFVRAGTLYQILSRPDTDNITGAIMERWRWF